MRIGGSWATTRRWPTLSNAAVAADVARNDLREVLIASSLNEPNYVLRWFLVGTVFDLAVEEKRIVA
jgi:hypothetical protein